MKPEEFVQHILDDDARLAGAQLRDLAAGELDLLVVLGSGLAQALDDSDRWPQPQASVALSRLPGVLAPVGDGHLDQLRIYELSEGGVSIKVGVAQGRTHLFEGHGPSAVTALARAAYCAGVHGAVLTNANGCLREWNLGEVMAIEDHLNLSGVSPFDGTVFLDTSSCWDPQLTDLLSEICQRRGSYAMLRGPEYQTRAESRLLASSGADCVGMSTVLEALTLHALGVRVCGMSVVSDLSFAQNPTDPTQVLASAAHAAQTVLAGLDAIVRRWPRREPEATG